MNKLLSLLLLLLISSPLLIAQSPTKTIKISVEQTVELKAIEVNYLIHVRPAREQLENYMYREFGYESYGEDEYIEMEEDESSDDYYARLRENREKLQREKDQKRANFKPFNSSDLIALLDKNKLDFKFEVLMTSEYGSEREYNYSDRSDTLVSVKLTKKGDYVRMMNLLKNKFIRLERSSMAYELVENHYENVIPILTKRAVKQADILASSLNKKVGDLIACANFSEGISNRNYYTQYSKRTGREGATNPFDEVENQIVQYIYTFELLN